MSRRGNRLDYDGERRRRSGLEAVIARRTESWKATLKTRTASGQRDELRRLCKALGRPEPQSFPEMAYDSRMEIQRLTLLLESKQRREAKGE